MHTAEPWTRLYITYNLYVSLCKVNSKITFISIMYIICIQFLFIQYTSIFNIIMYELLLFFKFIMIKNSGPMWFLLVYN